MKIPRRRFLQLAAGAAALPALPRIANAQTYPTRPVRLIVGYPAGAAGDIIARLIGQWLSERLGQPFIIENRAGANSNLATELVVRAAADGYSLLLAFSGNAINATLYDKLNFNFIRDILPVAGIVRTPLVMVVNPSFPARTIPEFIAYAKANPSRINMASAGIGNPTHLAGELFKVCKPVYQKVPITWTACRFGGRRPWFVCSVSSVGRYCGRRVAVLYGAGELFACRRCYGIAYASQQESSLYRWLRKAQKIRKRLGGSSDIFDVFPDKAKHMHWRSYERLRRIYRVAEASCTSSRGAAMLLRR
jgi:hypothetical protein